jgi:hypothetical protein
MAVDISPEYFADQFLEQDTSTQVGFQDAKVLRLRDDDFYIVDPADTTKRVRIDAGALTTATDVTLTVTDSGLTSTGMRTVVDTGGAFATPVVLTAADSGKSYLLDDAAGLDFTLPAIAAGQVGVHYRFYVVTTLTSNSYRFTAQAADLLMGNVLIVDKDAATGDTNALISVFRPDQSDDLVLTIGGSADTSGRLTGGWFEIEAISLTRWFVKGILIGDGSLVTVFA